MLPVGIVGGGPVGLSAALALAQEDVPVVVLERQTRPMADWRASTFHAPTLELLDRIGVIGDMLSEGLVVPRYQFRDRREGLIAEFDFGVLSGETRFPYRLQLNQQRLVGMLFERLGRMANVELRFGEEVAGVELESEQVRVTSLVGDGERRVFELSYLLGADGASSTVRRVLDIAFDGFTYPERFLITSTSVDIKAAIPDLGPVNYIADPDEWLFILRTPESWRVLWPVPSEVPEDVALSSEEIEAHLQSVAPRAEPYPILDRQIYAVNQRVAATFRLGRAMLLGDAAHINSPVGGVGLNSGIHDAIDAAIRLGRIWRGESDAEAELATFAERRRRVALEYVQADTERNTQRLKERDDSLRARNIAEMREIAADPERQRTYLRRVSLLESVQRFGIGTEDDGAPSDGAPGHGARSQLVGSGPAGSDDRPQTKGD